VRYTFGPINSRRFGLSLGIDLSPDSKSCNFDCLYCELVASKTTQSINNPPAVKDIVVEVKQEIEKNPNIEVITITSNGEPTLYKELDTLVDALNSIKKDKKLLILTNASTVTDSKIRAVLLKIDIVKLSLDCVTQKCFKKIDRPHKGIIVQDIVKAITDFSKIYDKELIIETLIVEGVNDKPSEIKELNRVLQDIKPNRIDLGTIDRPPAYDVKGVSSEVLKELAEYFTDLPVSIIHKDKPKNRVDFTNEQILTLLKRRPQSQADVDYLFSDSSKKRLMQLVKDGKVSSKIVSKVMFYQ
jgi:wyosine [tRNA(Phe)-imidazoG37] synthetase (radical SAM superfamily)